MSHYHVDFDAELIRRYDAAGPRYTSYPTAVQFHVGVGEHEYRHHAALANARHPARPLSLYFHIPFCATVCFYCACNRIITKNKGRAAPYLERLLREIAMQAALFGDRRVDQLHWGGGTPTFLSLAQMEVLMLATRAHFRLRDDDEGEYSIEIDPRTVDAHAIAFLRGLGFNRTGIVVRSRARRFDAGQYGREVHCTRAKEFRGAVVYFSGAMPGAMRKKGRWMRAAGAGRASTAGDAEMRRFPPRRLCGLTRESASFFRLRGFVKPSFYHTPLPGKA